VLALRATLSALALPANALLTVPGLILWSTADEVGWRAWRWLALVSWNSLIGGLLLLAGLGLLGWTVSLFFRYGRGTLAPWDPPRQLIITGPYAHVRHPMVSGVTLALIGQVVVLAAPTVLAWLALFVMFNALYLPLVEEPRLARRFGDDWRAYANEVPRWLPRLTPLSDDPDDRL